MEAKFKVGDKVRVVNRTNAQDWADGVEFTISRCVSGVLGNSSGWYSGVDATLNGEPFIHMGTSGDSGGIWEENLDLVQADSKFNVGDKVKLTPAGAKAYPKFENEVGTIEEIWKKVSYPYYLKFESGSQTYPVTDTEIELESQALDERVESLEKRLDALENPIVEEPVKGAKVGSEDLKFGTVVQLNGDYSIYFVKVDDNRWLANWGSLEYTDQKVNQAGIREVLHEGV